MNQLRRQDPNYSANVALKVNLKLGGTNQCVSPSDLGFLRHGKTMLVGIDVTHPAPDSIRGTPSIAGVVASIDANFSQWPGNICCQESKKEMVSSLDSMMKERLEYWASKNPGTTLENIVVYRDGKYNHWYEETLTHGELFLLGVSESQYMTVRREEIPAVRKACAEVFKDTIQPKITFLVVGKNHHTRFYPTEKRQADQKHNCNIQNEDPLTIGRQNLHTTSSCSMRSETPTSLAPITLNNLRIILATFRAELQKRSQFALRRTMHI